MLNTVKNKQQFVFIDAIHICAVNISHIKSQPRFYKYNTEQHRHPVRAVKISTLTHAINQTIDALFIG